MSNDRFDDDAEPTTGTRDGYRTDLADEPSIDTDVFEVVRVPTSPTLARIRYERDPVFASIVEMVVGEGEWRDAVQLLEESPGRRLKASKAHLGTATDAVPLDTDAPIAAVVEDDPRVAWLNDWADDPVSGYTERQVPEYVYTIRDALPEYASNVVDAGIDAFEGGEVTRRELESAVGEMASRHDVRFDDADIVVDGDTVGTVTDFSVDIDSDAFAKHDDSTPTRRGSDVWLDADGDVYTGDWSPRHVAFLVLIGVAIVVLILGALIAFAPP